MKFKVILKKASSLKELGHEVIENDHIETLHDLLCVFSLYEYHKQNNNHKEPYTLEEINHLSLLGKITFEKYNENIGDITSSIETMITDYKDGLFRVYLNNEECLSLDEKLKLQEENEVVFIKFVMLAGRLW